jgi:flavin reductase (DIM6/NTAB) family NADH-FMN oxidoreductase RutF
VASVSLNPQHQVVCVDKAAHAHEQLEHAGRFGVNILAGDQEGISRTFAETAEPEQGRLRGVAYHFGPQGTPVFDGCLAFLECEVADRCEGGDHTLFIGRVLGGQIEREAPPLLFYRGGYRRIEA